MAVQFKDVLLAMPAARRQQLQDIIRASINLDTNSTQTKPSVSPLIIKIPTPREQDIKDDSEVCASSVLKSDDGSSEEEDDWDAFQSFPATVDASNANSELQTPAADSSVDNLSSKTEIEDNGAQHLDDAEERAILEIRDEGNYDAKFSELQHSEDVTMSSTDHGEHVEAEICEDNEIQVSAELQTLADGEGLRREKLLKDTDNKSDCGVDLRVSLDSLPPECAELTTKAGVANLEGEISVRDYNCANDIQERLRRKESLEHSDQTIERSSRGGDDASSDPPSIENAPETGVESEVLKKEMSVEDSEQKIEKNGSEGNDIQASPDPLPVEDAPEAGAEAETLKKEMSVEDTKQKIERDGSGGNDLQASSDPLPHEYAPDASTEVEVLKKEMSMEDSEQKIEKNGSGNNDLQASSDPLPLESTQEPATEAVVPSYRGDELVREVDYVNDTRDTSYPQSLEDAGREAHTEHGSENSGIIEDYPKMEKD